MPRGDRTGPFGQGAGFCKQGVEPGFVTAGGWKGSCHGPWGPRDSRQCGAPSGGGCGQERGHGWPGTAPESYDTPQDS